LVDIHDRMLVIVGFPKCGTISLHQYLINKYGDNNVKRDECILQDHAVQLFKQRWGNMATPVIAFRDLPERCWSWYHHLKPDMTYYKFLRSRARKENRFGELNPIRQCNIKKWVTPWLNLKPLFFSFEAMVNNPEFPHLNESKEKLKMNSTQRDMTIKLLREEL